MNKGVKIGKKFLLKEKLLLKILIWDNRVKLISTLLIFIFSIFISYHQNTQQLLKIPAKENLMCTPPKKA